MNTALTFLRRHAPRVFSLSLALIVTLNLCGCLSMAAVDQARSRRFVDENGEVIRTEKGRPEMYCWLPLTIPVDAVIGIFWLALEGMTQGSSGGDYSPKESKKLQTSK
jgi:hypothetical protein